MTDFFITANLYLKNHPLVFGAFFAFIMLVLLIQLIFTMVHILRGNQCKLAIGVSVATLLTMVTYCLYLYVFLAFSQINKFLYFITMANFLNYHWVVAYVYFESACTIPFHKSSKESFQYKYYYRAFFWIIFVLNIIASAFIFFKNSISVVLFTLLCLLLLNASVIMCVALVKIKKAIGNYIKNRAKNKQMINHALAFILYTSSYAAGKLLDFVD
jgi:hypothetical protein